MTETTTSSELPSDELPDRPTGNGTRRRRRDHVPPGVLGLAAASGVALATADVHPTGHRAVDVVYLVLFGAALPLAASRARRRVLVVAGALCAFATIGFGAPSVLAAVLAVGAFGVAVVMGLRDLRAPELGALVGGLAASSVVRLDLEWIPRGGSIVAAGVAGLLVVSGARNSPRPTRRLVRRVAIGTVAVGALATGLGVLAAVRASGPVRTGADRTAAAVRAAGDGKTTDAADQFDRARQSFDDAVEASGAWWTAPAALVPVVSQNLDAVQTASESGAALSATAARITRDVRYDRLRREGGGVDLGVLRSFRSPVEQAASELRAADGDLRGLSSPWLVGPLADRLDEFRDKVTDVLNETELAELAVRAAPGLLGDGTSRRYLVLLGNPAELRDVGGHIGNWAELAVDGGVLDLVKVGGPLELSRPEGEPDLRADPIRYPPSMVELQPARYPQNWGGSPDFRQVARVSADLYEQKVGHPVDGVIYADPSVLSVLLGIVGEVPVAGLDEAIGSDDVVEFLTEGQFGAFPDDDAADIALRGFIGDVFDRFSATKLPGPRRMGQLFSPAVRSGRLRFVSLHGTEAALLRRMHLDEATVPAPGDDMLAVVNRNVNPSKIDVYLHRTVRYDVVWRPETGEVDGRVRVELRNDAPTTGLPPVVIGNGFGGPPGTNRTDVAVVTPLGLVDAFVDGEDTPVGSIDEGRLHRHTVRVELGPGETRTIEFRLSGALASGSRYRLRVVGQPMASESPTDVVVRTTGPALEVPAGSRLQSDGVHTLTVGQLRRDVVLFAR